MYRLSPSRIPADVVLLCRRLVDAGYPAFVVGGAVRDLLLYEGSAQAKDFDVATSAHPDDVVRVFGARRTIPTGIAHGTVTVLCDRAPQDAGRPTADDESGVPEHKHRHVEVTTFRGETGYSDGRRPDRIEFIGDLVEDLRRRDFTINAIAYDPLADRLHDPFDGKGDLSRRLLRAVGDPVQRFAEDGLRLLRAVRFAARLNFQIELDTRMAFSASLPTLRKVSRERVRDELLRLIAAPHPAIGLRHLFEPALPISWHADGPHPSLTPENSLLSVALPEVCAVLGPDAEAAWRWVQLIESCEPDRRLAALLWPLRRCDASLVPKDARRLSMLLDDRLKLPLSQRQHLAALLLLPDLAYSQDAPWPGPQIRRFLAAHPPTVLDDFTALREQELRIATAPHAADDVRALRLHIAKEREGKPALSTAELALSGQDLLTTLRIPAGPRVGQVLRHLLECVLDDPSANDRDRLLAEAQRFLTAIGG